MQGIKLSQSIETRVCSQCDLLLAPGTNCRVRLLPRSSKTIRKKKRSVRRTHTVVSLHCLACGHRNEYKGASATDIESLESSCPPLTAPSARISSKKPSPLPQLPQTRKLSGLPAPKSTITALQSSSSPSPAPTKAAVKKNRQKNSLKSLLAGAKKKQSNQAKPSLSDFLQEF